MTFTHLARAKKKKKERNPSESLHHRKLSLNNSEVEVEGAKVLKVGEVIISYNLELLFATWFPQIQPFK